MERNRRQTIIERIEARCDIVNTGLVLDGCPSPCHLWTGPHSGEGRGGAFEGFSVDPTFWDKLAIIKEIEIPDESRNSFFSCSC